MIKNRLKIILAERDMNLSQLAELTGLHYTTLRRFARDDIASIHRKTLNAICKMLEIQPGELLVYKDDSHE